VTDIPVPPFADFDAADQFHRLLLLYLRELKQPGDPVALHQFLLGQALYWHAPRGGAACAQCQPPSHTYACQNAGNQPGGGGVCAQCGPPYPCRTLLTAAAVARFPVPWTPVSLARAMKSVGFLSLGDGQTDDPITPTQLRWGGDGWVDPRLTATRDQHTGSWVVRSQERSSTQTERFADDSAFCDHLLDQALAMAFPYAWKVEPSWVLAVQPGVARARSWWSYQVQLPYLENERPSGTR
jgi:hypothetical protein